MNDKRLDRREFLHAAGAAALLTGLSHFRFLNINVSTAFAAPLDACDQGEFYADYCNPGEAGATDTCPDPNIGVSSDVCLPEQGEPDKCDPPNEADVCDPADEPADICAPDQGDPDGCEMLQSGLPETPDTCGGSGTDNPDICPDGGPPLGDGDICNQTAPQASPDECIPAVNESDSCFAADPDFCRNPGTGQVESDQCYPTFDPPDPDICYQNGQNVEDACNSGINPPDDPNAVGLSSFTGRPAASAAPLSLGGLAVLAGAATVARRAGQTQSSDTDTA